VPCRQPVWRRGEIVVRRDRTSEIIGIKTRGGSATNGAFASYTLDALKREWDKLSVNREVPSDFYIIRAVTILEVFTRARIGMLVDLGKDYAKRATDLLKDYRIDFDLVQSVYGRTIALGNIVAHSVQINSFGQIVDHFKVLLEFDLSDRLAKAVDRWETEVKKKPSCPIIPVYASMAAQLKRLFELRHILCHELPKKAVYSRNEISDLLGHAVTFADALQNVLNFEMYGLTPLTQTEMNIDAGRRLRSKEHELEALIESIRSEISWADGEIGTLQISQETWKAYRDAYCEFSTWLNRGGSIRSTLWAGRARDITEQRIAQVRSWKEHRSSL
jgi:uncharacterized protein YecT (DUF1311 family)